MALIDDFIIKKYRARKLFKLIQWIVTQSSSPEHLYDGTTLIGRIYDKTLEVEPQYRLDKTEKEIISEILILYQDYLKKGYFNQSFALDRKTSKLSEYEYFIYSLLRYLEHYEGDDVFNNHEFYSRTYIKEDCAALYKTVYTITDFGIAYNKLLYLLYFLCEKNTRTEKVLYSHRAYLFKDFLDKCRQ